MPSSTIYNEILPIVSIQLQHTLQNDSVNCGIFVMKFAELMTRSEELFFDIRTINNIRKDMACNLLASTSEYILQFFLLVFMLVMNFLDLLNYVHFSK